MHVYNNVLECCLNVSISSQHMFNSLSVICLLLKRKSTVSANPLQSIDYTY